MGFDTVARVSGQALAYVSRGAGFDPYRPLYPLLLVVRA